MWWWTSIIPAFSHFKNLNLTFIQKRFSVAHCTNPYQGGNKHIRKTTYYFHTSQFRSTHDHEMMVYCCMTMTLTVYVSIHCKGKIKLLHNIFFTYWWDWGSLFPFILQSFRVRRDLSKGFIFGSVLELSFKTWATR